LWGGLYARQFTTRNHGGHKARPTTDQLNGRLGEASLPAKIFFTCLSGLRDEGRMRSMAAIPHQGRGA
jgi:hypothetical protein